MVNKKRSSGRKAPVAAPRAALPLLEPGMRLRRPYLAALLLMFLLLSLLSFRQAGSLDAGWHLKAGQSILSGHGWPVNDAFTYTLNDHPYVDTSWGYQVLLYLTERTAGAPGMVVLHWLMLMGLFYLLYRTARLAPVDPVTLVLMIGAGIMTCEMRFNIRPELLSYLYLGAILYVLHRRALGFKAALWLLPLLLWLWANSHALFAMGWAAIACTAAGLWIRDRKPDMKLLGWGGASLLSPLVNPYGIKGWAYPFMLLTRFQSDNPFAKNIQELASPFSVGLTDQNRFYIHWPIWSFRILAVLAVAAVLFLLARKKYWAAFIALAFLPLSVRAIHNMPLLIITALPVMIWALPALGLWRLLGLRDRPARAAAFAALIAGGLTAVVLSLRVITGAYYVDDRRPIRFGLGWDHGKLPVEAVDYVKRTGLRGPMFNDLGFGGYLEWMLPQKVFIDGRNEMMGEDFFTQYQGILTSPEALERTDAKYGFEWIIFPYITQTGFLARLSADPRWVLAYVDDLSVVFVKQGPEARRWVDRASLERRAPPAPALNALPGLGGPDRATPLARWFRGLFGAQHYPQEEYRRAIFHYYRNEFPEAEAWLRAALAHGGEDYFEMYMNLGANLYKQNDYDGAARCFEETLKDDPHNSVARQYLTALTPLRMAQ